MHAVLSSLTAALLFIHAAFGCCWHHVHRCAEHGDSLALAESANCHHHGGCGEHQEPAQPCGCKIECGGSCAYLLPQKIRIDAPRSMSSVLLVAALLKLTDAPNVSAAWIANGDTAHKIAPAVRLHLLHQSMLN